MIVQVSIILDSKGNDVAHWTPANLADLENAIKGDVSVFVNESLELKETEVTFVEAIVP